GFAGTYTAVTAGVTYKPKPGVWFRPELRFDNNSESRPFEGKPNLFTAAFDCIIRWGLQSSRPAPPAVADPTRSVPSTIKPSTEAHANESDQSTDDVGAGGGRGRWPLAAGAVGRPAAEDRTARPAAEHHGDDLHPVPGRVSGPRFPQREGDARPQR